MNVRTDLALEARELFQDPPQGVTSETFSKSGIDVTRVQVSEAGSLHLSKPKGEYVTLEASPHLFYDLQSVEGLVHLLAEELSRLLKSTEGTTLVVGLGNRDITADALGPFTVERMLVTRHLKEAEPLFDDWSMTSVCGLIPGVLGITGIESAEIVRGVAERVRPARIILIDALAARRMSRVNTTLQLSDTGICPGAGVGNHRMALDRDTLGVPVFSVGVPTVVDAATIVWDAVSGLGDEETCRNILAEVVGADSPFVTPKEVDSRVRRLSEILAEGISLALQPDLGLEEIRELRTP